MGFGFCFLVFFYKGTNPIPEGLQLMTSQRSYLQILSHWALGFNVGLLGRGYTSSLLQKGMQVEVQGRRVKEKGFGTQCGLLGEFGCITSLTLGPPHCAR